MASPQKCSAAPFSSTRARFDEHRWLSQIRSDLDAMEEAADVPSPVAVAVAAVPKALMASKPEAYVPQLLALGPYHHWDAQLYEMERYKLASVNRTQKQLRNMKLQQLAESFIANDQKTRSYYHRHLDLDKETLAWMMVIDASFLLEFLHNYGVAHPQPGTKYSFTELPSMSNMVDYSARTSQLDCNSVLRDVVMLQNQIPLFLVRKILCFQSSSAQAANEALRKMLVGFAKELSPLEFSDVTSNASLAIDVRQQAHLLQFLYLFIVSHAREACKSSCGSFEEPVYVVDVPAGSAGDDEPSKFGSSSAKSTLFNSTWDFGAAVMGKLLSLALKLPWAIVSKLSCLYLTFNSAMTSLMPCGSGEESDDQQDSTEKPAQMDETITIPTVSELARAGVRFSATKGDLTTISFDTKTATLCIPTMIMDVNTEVVLRNLVAYETSIESGPMIVTGYTELISRIVATDEDVRLLRRAGIIVNRMAGDQEAASVWNGMCRPARAPAKVEFIDRVMVDVNVYYNRRWSVKARKFAREYVFGPWQLLTLLAVLLLLFMTCVQSFCSVYNCDSHWTSKMASLEQGWSGPEA